MNRIGFVLKVRPDLLDDYKRHHRAVWPEMLDALRRTPPG
jgi:L-rhamnose mutarotase